MERRSELKSLLLYKPFPKTKYVEIAFPITKSEENYE